MSELRNVRSIIELNPPVRVEDDPRDAAGADIIVTRTINWDSEDCREAGRVVGRLMLEAAEGDPYAAFEWARDVALQEPPLQGERLTSYEAGARSATLGEGEVA